MKVAVYFETNTKADADHVIASVVTGEQWVVGGDPWKEKPDLATEAHHHHHHHHL